MWVGVREALCLFAFRNSVLLDVFCAHAACNKVIMSYPPTVLEARIQQLQSDVILDVQHTNVQILKAPQTGRGTASTKGPRNVSGERGEMPKSGQTGHRSSSPGGPSSPKAHNSRWIEKLKTEKWMKTRKQARLQLKLQEKMAKEGKGSLMLPGTSKKTISTTKKSKVTQKQEQPKTKKLKSPRPAVAAHETYSSEAELAEVEELDQQVNQWVSASAEKLLEDNEGNRYGDAQLSVRCFLEACVFIGDIDRAQRCLNSHHRNITKRKLLSMSAYNIMLRVWAKKVSPTLQSCLFTVSPCHSYPFFYGFLLLLTHGLLH